jgi:hypothetical protein
VEHVAVEGSEWCDVEDGDAGVVVFVVFGAKVFVEDGQEGCFGFAQACRGDKEDIFSLDDVGDGFGLGFGGYSYIFGGE